jgi:SNF family Na+-dependent transporter
MSIGPGDGAAGTRRSSGDVERWATRLGVILAVAGSAVGLGNFLRFPGQAVANGGGAFMIPYFCALLLLGIPIGWAEWTMGRYGGSRGLHSAPAILGVIGRGAIARYFGALGLLIPLVVYMYYGLIESWCLRYAWAYLTGTIDLGPDPAGHVAASQEFFAKVSGSSYDGVILRGHLDTSVVFWLIVFAVNVWLVYRGLSRGIETFCRWAMPAMAICAVIVLIRVLTLGTPDPALPDQNVSNGLGFMWNPDFSRLGDFQTWLAAAGQVFFSLSVGFGVIINYASYLRRRDDVVLSGLTASATNELFEVGFGGLITVTAAFVFLGASGAAGGTFGLGFNTLPVVFLHMGPLGRWIGAIWFFMLFLAAITSSLSMLQPVKAFVQESLGVGAGKAVALVALVAGGGSFWVIWFSKDLAALDTMDFWVGTFAIFVLAGVQIICFGWVFGVDRGLREAHVGAQIRIPRIFRFIIKYVAPTYLLVVFVGFCTQNLPAYARNVAQHEVVRGTVVLIGLVLALLVALVWAGARRLRAAGVDVDGNRPHPEGEPV